MFPFRNNECLCNFKESPHLLSIDQQVHVPGVGNRRFSDVVLIDFEVLKRNGDQVFTWPTGWFEFGLDHRNGKTWINLTAIRVATFFIVVAIVLYIGKFADLVQIECFAVDSDFVDQPVKERSSVVRKRRATSMVASELVTASKRDIAKMAIDNRRFTATKANSV